MPRVSLRAGLLALALGIAVVAVATFGALYSHNTLAAHPEWVTGKLLLAEPIMGAAEQYAARNLLYRNRLDLGAFHGFNEVLLDRPFALGRLRFRFRIEDSGYLYVVFNRTATGFSAFRLSRSAAFPSAYVRAEAGGRFLVRRVLAATAIASGWHEGELRIEDGRARVSIDGLTAFEHTPEETLERRVVGFRSGHDPVSVDDVSAWDASGRAVVHEDFANWRGAAGFAATLAAVLVVVAFSLGWSARRGALTVKRATYAFITLEIALLGMLAPLVGFDYLVWSGRYDRPRQSWSVVHPRQVLGHAERARRAAIALLPFVAGGRSQAGPSAEFRRLVGGVTMVRRPPLLSIVRGGGGQKIEELRDTADAVKGLVARDEPTQPLRVLWLGTSQAWGAGAYHPAERIAARVQRHLSEALPERDVVVLNASRRGSRAARLLERYRSHLRLFAPELVVVQLSNNDVTDGFAATLEEIVGVARDQSATTLFVLEANASESPRRLTPKHAIMAEVGASEGVAVVDLHTHLTSGPRSDSGVLWWDRVHLTPWGQELAGRFLADAILRVAALATAHPRPTSEPVQAGAPSTASPDTTLSADSRPPAAS